MDNADLLPPELRVQAEAFVARQWALRRVQEWLFAGSDRFMLISGDPGTGKTSLSAWLLGGGSLPEDEADRAALIAVRSAWSGAYFCSSRLPTLSLDPRDFSRTLSRQLAKSVPDFETSLLMGLSPTVSARVAVGNNRGLVQGVSIDLLLVNGSTAADTFAMLVREPLVALLEADAERKVAILIDGIDETTAYPSPNILDMLRHHVGGPPNLRLLITSRNDARVVRDIREAYPDVVHLDLSRGESQAQAQEDVARYVDVAVAEQASSTMLAPNEIQDAARLIKAKAGTNFLCAKGLVDGVLAGEPLVWVRESLPDNLQSMYESSLHRLMDAHHEGLAGTRRTTGVHRAVLGCLAVTMAPVPESTLAGLIGMSVPDLTYVSRDLSQLVAFDSGTRTYTLCHASLQAFLTTPELSSGETNVFLIDERAERMRIVDYLLDRVRTAGWSAVDTYGLLAVVAQLVRLCEAQAGERAVGDHADTLYELLVSDDYQRALIGKAPDAVLRAQPFRLGLDALLAAGEQEQFRGLLTHVCGSADAYIRGTAIAAIQSYARHYEQPAEELLRRQLLSPDINTWSTALRSLVTLRAELSERLYGWLLENASDAVRKAAPYSLYLTRAAAPAKQTNELLGRLSQRVSPLRLRRSKKLLDFVSNVTITNYINNCDDTSLMGEISAVWESILVDRLYAKSLNKPIVERLVLAPTLARILANQVLDAAMAPDLHDVDRFFKESGRTAPVARRLIARLDPATSIHDVGPEILELLGSEFFVFRVLAAHVVAIHAFADMGTNRAWIEGLYDQAGDETRYWLVLAFSVLLRDTPADWLELTDVLTSDLVRSRNSELMSFGRGLLANFDISFMPLALASGKANVKIRLLAELIGGTDRALRERALHGLGMLGLYYPRLALAMMADALAAGQVTGDDLVGGMATIYPMHPGMVDVFLQQRGFTGLEHRVAVAADLDRTRRYLDLLGHYNNGVNEAVRHPKMRVGLCEPVYTLLLEAKDARDFLRRYLKVTLGMLRRANYRMSEWTTP